MAQSSDTQKIPTKLGKETADTTDLKEATYRVFLEHQKRAFEEAGKAVEALIPEAVRDHGATAIKEIMESYRALFGAIMDEVNTSIDDAKQNISSKDKVEVEEPVT